jgi:phosphoenolpyruvate carboxylase
LDTVLANMLKETTKRIENAQKSKEGRPALKDEERLARRKELRARLAEIEAELSSERKARTEAEHLLASVRLGGQPPV